MRLDSLAKGFLTKVCGWTLKGRVQPGKLEDHGPGGLGIQNDEYGGSTNQRQTGGR